MKALKVAAIVAALLAAVAIGAAWAPIAHGQARTRAAQAFPIGGAQIGVSIRDVDEADAKSAKLAAQAGVVVDDVRTDSPAEKAGIKKGDVVVEYDGERIRGVRQFQRLVQETPSGRKVQVALSRDGQRMNVTVEPRDGGLLDWFDDGNGGRVFRELGRDFSREFGVGPVPVPPTPPAPPGRPAPPARPVPPPPPAAPIFRDFLSSALLGLALLAAPQAPDPRGEAERLANSGAYEQALRQFQALASANPDDVQARMWIARLHVLMGHPGRAADVYGSIVATQPQNLEALIGLGDALTRGGRFREATDALNRAEALSANSIPMLTAQGRLHEGMGHYKLALAYYGRALSLEPGNSNARKAFDTLRAERAHRVEGIYDFESFSSGVDDTQGGAGELNARVSDALRLFGIGQHVSKFGVGESRGGGGLEWFTGGTVRVRAGGLFGGDIVLPDADTWFDVERRNRAVTWIGGIRYLHFTGSSTFTWSPGLRVAVGDAASLTVRYYRSESAFDTAPDTGSNGLLLGVGGRAGRLAVDASYVRGFEALPLITFERAAQFDANSVMAGLRFDFTPFTSIGGLYTHQRRAEDVNVNTLRVNLIQRF